MSHETDFTAAISRRKSRREIRRDFILWMSHTADFTAAPRISTADFILTSLWLILAVLRHSQHCLLDLWNKPAVGWLAAAGSCSGAAAGSGRPGQARPATFGLCDPLPIRMTANGNTDGFFIFDFRCWRWVMGYWFNNPFSIFENLMGNGYWV